MKLYLVTRSDLPEGARAAQLAHGAVQFQYEHPDTAKDWFVSSNNLVLLEVADEGAIRALARRADRAGVPRSIVIEPDFGNTVTAVAIGPGGARLLSSLPLALK